MLTAEVWFTVDMQNTYHAHRGTATYRTAASKALAASAAPTCGHDAEKFTTVFVTGEDKTVRRVRKCQRCMLDMDMRKNGR